MDFSKLRNAAASFGLCKPSTEIEQRRALLEKCQRYNLIQAEIAMTNQVCAVLREYGQSGHGGSVMSNTCPHCGAPTKKCPACGEEEYQPSQPSPVVPWTPFYPYLPYQPYWVTTTSTSGTK